MHVDVNGARLWFDVEGPALVPDGPAMRSRPTIVLLHGGPGSYDHSYFKPDFSRLALARLEVLPGAGHFPWKDAPDAYFATLLEFVTSLDAYSNTRTSR